jgi:Calx-beta domain
MEMNWLNHSADFLKVAAAAAFALALSACGGSISPSGTSALTGTAAATATSTAATTPATPDSLAFADSSYSVAQVTGTITLSVSRSGTTTAAVSVEFATADGTAVGGTDYTATSGTLQWAAGDSTAQTIVVPISNAAPFMGSKAFQVTLSSAGGGAALGSPSAVTVTINGDGTATTGAVAFSAASYSVAQGAGTVQVAVNRTTGSAGVVTVAYASSNGTAVAGTNYTAALGTLQWASGDTTPKTFTVPISNATPFTGTKSFSVALSNPTTGVTVATPSSASITITGDASATASPAASAGVLQLSASSYTVAQSSGSLAVTVNRTGGSADAVSVGYSTTDGTAVAGTNYTAATGTLQWASGDATSKTLSVPISDATSFAGTKTFTVTLSSPSGGATLGTPTSAGVTITGSSSTTDGGTSPSAPTGLTMTGQTATSISIAWSAATPGAAPIDHYKIYRNGASYATSTSLSYVDTKATNATSPVPGNAGPSLVTANTVYAYAVSAVDTAGNEGPQQSNATFWVYDNGVFNWGGDFSYPAGSININYASTAGDPESGSADIEVSYTAKGAGFQPYAGKTVTVWDMEGGSFGYISIDLKPTITSDSWYMLILSRLPPGDVAPWSTAQLSNYGPKPVAGQWATYKIPLSALTIGYTNFTGSISGTTLTISSVSSGVGVDAGGYVTGPGVPAGTYITSYGTARGGAGNYTVAGPGISSSTRVASTSMVEQRTGIYKFNLVDQSSAGTNQYYVDNVKFTVD